MKKTYYYWIAIIVVIILTPIGLLADGDAWGEWDPDVLKEQIHYIPQGMAHFPVSWNAIMPDYSIEGISDAFWAQSLAYILAAIVGVVLITVIFRLLMRGLSSNGK